MDNEHLENPPSTPESTRQSTDQSSTASASKHHHSPSDNQRVWFAFIALMLTILMSSLGQMIFSTALPTIVGDLGGVELMSWVITSFMLAQTIAMPIFGKLSDQMSRKHLLIGVIVVFIVGSIIGGFAQSMTMLIAARLVQGAAGGGLMILSQAITAEVVSARDRGKYMGIMGAVFGVSSVLGPVLGGWFTDGPGWRWGLWLNVPLGIVAIAGIVYFLHDSGVRARVSVDVWGVLTMAVATSSLILMSTWGGNTYEWSDPIIIALGISAAVFYVAFFFIERKVKDPLVPPSVFSVRNFNLTTLAGIATGVFMFGTLAYLPTYMQMVHMMSPTKAGLMMTPMMVGMLMTSTLVGNLVTRYGRYKWYPVVSMVGTFFAMVALSFMEPDTPLWVVGIMLLALGAVLGIGMQILVLIVQNSFSLSQVGTATAANNFFRQIGGTLGSALVGGLFTGALTDNLKERLPQAIAQLPPEVQQQMAQAGGGPAIENLTPGMLSGLPEAIQLAVQQSYSDALTPIFFILSPLALVAALILAFVKEEPLKTEIK